MIQVYLTVFVTFATWFFCSKTLRMALNEEDYRSSLESGFLGLFALLLLIDIIVGLIRLFKLYWVSTVIWRLPRENRVIVAYRCLGKKPQDWKPSGKRTKRGLYRTTNNWYVNADAQSAGNIIRFSKLKTLNSRT